VAKSETGSEDSGTESMTVPPDGEKRPVLAFLATSYLEASNCGAIMVSVGFEFSRILPQPDSPSSNVALEAPLTRF
jgi:hypothetical protein